MFQHHGMTGADVTLALPPTRVRTMLDPMATVLPGLRFFKSSPDTVTIQIRTEGKVVSGRRGIKRKAISQAEITPKELDAAIAELQRLRAML